MADFERNQSGASSSEEVSSSHGGKLPESSEPWDIGRSVGMDVEGLSGGDGNLNFGGDKNVET